MGFAALNSLIRDKKTEIEYWMDERQQEVRPPLFTSLDIRDSGYKTAHVDANLFPAGFNNLSENAAIRATEQFSSYMRYCFPDAKKILIIPENFTRNIKYLESLLRLKRIIKAGGYEVVIGSPYIESEAQFEKPEHFNIQSLELENGQVKTNRKWIPDLIILNNDLTSEVPDMLKSCNQPILPETDFGWHKRRKHRHFMAYAKVAAEFAAEFGFDPWLISTWFEKCGTINFREKQGIECVANFVDKVIAKTKAKYDEYGINAEPYVFIKADRGTYGLGVMTAYAGEDILHINKKYRHSMDVIKQGVHNTEIVIQEGIPTIEKNGEFPSETLVYMVAGRAVGNIIRWNVNHNDKENLNSRGMGLLPSGFGEYGLKMVIARLAAIAITREAEVSDEA